MQDFRVLRAVVELRENGMPVTLESVTRYLAKMRQNTKPDYDEDAVDNALLYFSTHRLMSQGNYLVPKDEAIVLVENTRTSTEPNLASYRMWSSKITTAPRAAVVAG